MARKLFISILGTGYYSECEYCYEGVSYPKTKYIQIATLEQIGARTWTDEDAIRIFMTDKAERDNWDKSLSTRVRKGVESEYYTRLVRQYIGEDSVKCVQDGVESEYTRLEAELDAMGLNADVKAIKGLPIGKNVNEIWEIFNLIFSEVQEGDELYIDLTHGLRYMPMIALALSDYTKFLRSTRLKQLSYGSFETKDASGHVPIINLMPLAALQNWTTAASDFMRLGHADSMKSAIKDELAPLLRDKDSRTKLVVNTNALGGRIDDYVNELITCRGISIANGVSASNLIEGLECIENTGISALNPILDVLRNSIRISDSKAERCYSASVWCFEKKLYQQSLTLLQEGIITFFCLRCGIDYADEAKRGAVGYAFDIMDNYYAGKLKEYKNSDELNNLLSDELLRNREFVHKYVDLKNVRNDYNHAGFRSKQLPLEPNKIKAKLSGYFDFFGQYLMTGDTCVAELANKRDRVFLNLSNHPSEDWESAQIFYAQEYGRIYDRAFPQVDSGLDSAGIDALAEDIKCEILNEYSRFDLTVHVMGEMTMTYALVSKLKSCGIRCVASCTDRVSSFDPETGVKSSVFKFKGFREY